MFGRDRERIRSLGASAGSALQIHDLLKEKPILLRRGIISSLQLSRPTVYSALNNLEHLGIIRRMRKRNQLIIYDEYLNALNEGTEPP